MVFTVNAKTIIKQLLFNNYWRRMKVSEKKIKIFNENFNGNDT